MKNRRTGLGYINRDRRARVFLNRLKRSVWRKRWLLIVGAAAVVAVVVLSVCFASQGTVTAAAEGTAAASLQAYLETPSSGASPSLQPKISAEPTPDPVLKRGDENADVQKLQERLMELGYMAIDESTQLYGPATEYAVQLFQRQYTIVQTGVADLTTQALIYSSEAKHYTLLQGTSGDDVDSLQRQLIGLGFMEKATGYYGTETIEAVKAFQKRNNLTIDGKTGQETLDLLFSPNALESTSKAKKEQRRANIMEVIATAENQLGDRYVWGAQGPNSFDCSGLVYYCLMKAGSSRNRYDAAGYSQVSDWEKITSLDDLEKGDLLFFSTNGKRVGHTGIYIGGGMMIDASSARGKVVKRECKTGFWVRAFVCARRPW